MKSKTQLAAAALGRIKSAAKTAAARENAKKPRPNSRKKAKEITQ